MKVIDANTGEIVQVGVPFNNVVGNIKVLEIDEGWFSARALVSIDGSKANWTPLIVRFTHPGFFGQKVAFLPS